MSHRLLLSGIVAIGIAASTIVSAPAQTFTGASASSTIGQAYVLAARIRGFHRWTGATAPPASYCPTMRAGEAIMVELARLANRTIRYRQPGLALELQRAATGSAMSSTNRRGSTIRPVCRTAFIPAPLHSQIPRAQLCFRSSNDGCPPVGGRRMRGGPRSMRVER